MTIFTVDSGIDPTGTTDVGIALRDWLNANVTGGTSLSPNVVRFQPGAIYRSERKVFFQLTDNLYFDLNGGTLKNTIRAPYSDNGTTIYTVPTYLVKSSNRTRSVFEFDKCDNIQVFGGTLRGACPNNVTTDTPVEAQCGILMTGGAGYEFYNLTIRNVYGDFVETIRSYTTAAGGQPLPSDIHVHDVDMLNACRQGVTCAGGTDYLVENCTINNTAHHIIDLESDDPTGSVPIQRFTFRANTCGGGHLGLLAMGGKSRTVTDITIGGTTQADGNHMVGDAMDVNGHTPTQIRRQRFLMSWNTADGEWGQGTLPAGLIWLRWWDGVTVQHNGPPPGQVPVPNLVQPGTGDAGVLTDNCTNVVVNNNNFTGAAIQWQNINPVNTIAGTATLTGGGTLSSAGTVSFLPGNAHLFGGGVLTATGLQIVSGTADCPGGGVLAAVGQGFLSDVTGTADLQGGGTLSAAGDVITETFGTADCHGGGTLTAVGTRRRKRRGERVGEIGLRGPGYGAGPYGKGPWGGFTS